MNSTGDGSLGMDELRSDAWLHLITHLQAQFPNILSSERWIFVFGSLLTYYLAFWGQNFILYILYKLNAFPEYQIQAGAKADKELVWRNLKDTIFSHIVLLPLMVYFLYDLFILRGTKILSPLPPTSIILRDLLIALVCVDTFGYWGHRAVHHKSVYKYIHKQHHEYKVTVGIASVFANPLEDILVNTWSSLSGCLIMGSHVVVLWIWLAIRVSEAVNSHSGYHFLPYWLTDWFSAGEFHEYHHSHNIGNYGAFTTFWDKLMGTDVHFKQYLQQKIESKKLKKQ